VRGQGPLTLGLAEIHELHSLRRYPPIAVRDGAAARLERAGLVRVYFWRGSGRRYRLTRRGVVVLHQTAMLCGVPHCPCHGGDRPDTRLTPADIEAHVDRLIAERPKGETFCFQCQQYTVNGRCACIPTNEASQSGDSP
jgi:hypothetical protein